MRWKEDDIWKRETRASGSKNPGIPHTPVPTPPLTRQQGPWEDRCNTECPDCFSNCCELEKGHSSKHVCLMCGLEF